MVVYIDKLGSLTLRYKMYIKHDDTLHMIAAPDWDEGSYPAFQPLPVHANLHFSQKLSPIIIVIVFVIITLRFKFLSGVIISIVAFLSTNCLTDVTTDQLSKVFFPVVENR